MLVEEEVLVMLAWKVFENLEAREVSSLSVVEALSLTQTTKVSDLDLHRFFVGSLTMAQQQKLMSCCAALVEVVLEQLWEVVWEQP